MDLKRFEDPSAFSVVFTRSITCIEFAYDWIAAKWLRQSWIDYITATYAKSPLLGRRLKSIEEHVHQHFMVFESAPDTDVSGSPEKIDQFLGGYYLPATARGVEGLNAVSRVIKQKQSLDQWLTLYLDLSPIVAEEQFKEKLEELWKTTMGTTPSTDSDYRDLGFQRVDPMSDFRSLGMLTLIMMVHFAQHHKEFIYIGQAMEELPFALTSMQVTKFVVQLHRNRKLGLLYYIWDADERFRNEQEPLSVVHNIILCKLLEDFHKSSYSVMEFTVFWAEFSDRVVLELESLEKNSYFLNDIKEKGF